MGKSRYRVCFRCSAPISENWGYCDRCFQISRVMPVIYNIRALAKKFGVVNELTTSEWFEILEAAQGLCFYCGGYIGLEDLVIEHQMPMSRGGPNTKSNVVPACRSCNSKKGSKTPEEFEEWMRGSSA